MFQRGKKVLRSVLAYVLVLTCVLGALPGSVMEACAAPSDAPYGHDNLPVEYTTLDEGTVTSEAKGKPKVLIFFGARCGNSRYAIQDICSGSYDFSDVDMVAVEIQTNKEQAQTFKNNYGNDKITFAYDFNGSANRSAWDYLDRAGMDRLSGMSLPFIIYIDKNNKFQYAFAGATTAKTVRDNIDRYCLSKEVQEPSRNTTTVQVNVEYHQAEARKMLGMVNAFRTGDDAWYWNENNSVKFPAKGLQALSYDYKLEEIAMKRAAELAMSYSHTRPNGEDTRSAFLEAGYADSMGENIAAGVGSSLSTAQNTFVAWREDEKKYEGQGHRRNMLNGMFTSIGIGCVYYNGTYYWAMELGGARTGAQDSRIDGARTVPVEIKNEDIRSLTVDNKTLTIGIGNTAAAPAVRVNVASPDMWPPANSGVFKGYPSGTVSSSWSVANSSVVSFENGTFVGKAKGTTTATATVAGKSVAVTLKVSGSSGSNNGGGSSIPEYSDDVTTIAVNQIKYNTLQLSWAGTKDAKSYEIYYSTSPNSGFRRLANAKKTTYRFTKAKCGQTYYFQVRVCTKSGKSSFGPVASGQTNLKGAPTISVSKTTYNSVTIKWKKVDGAKKYEIYAYINGSWKLLKTQGGTSFTHKKLQTGATYEYMVRPVRDTFKGEESNTVSATTVLGSVTRLKVRASGPDRMKVSFRKVPGVDYYVILRADSRDGEYTEIARVKKTSYVDLGLKPSTTYFYKVYAVAGPYKTNVEGPVGQTTKMPKNK